MSAKRALIVDDSRSARTFLTRILQRYDLEVDGAASAEEALQYLRAEHPDVIFMDHLMPGMDGFQALSAIKSDPRTAAIPVMMYTSQEGALYLDQARALGAVGVLPKQTLPDDVNRALQQLHLLGESKPVELVRASLAPVAAETSGTADAATASGPAAAANDAPLNLMTPELRAQFDALLRDHGIELRRFVAASLAQHTGQIISEVRALMDGTAPAAAAPVAAAPMNAAPSAAAASAVTPVAAAAAELPVATPPAPAEPTRASGPLHGGAAALWLGAVAALIAMAAGLFWYQARRQEGRLVPRPSTVHSSVPVPANPNTPAQSPAAPPAPAATPSTGAAATPAPAGADPAAGDAAPASTAAPMQMVETVPFGELPLAGARIASLRALLQRLAATGFHGVVEVRSFPGRFCMLANGPAPQLPPADAAYGKCARVGNPVNYADAHSLQSPEFETLLAAQAGRSRGTLDVQLVVGEANEVATPYPAISAALTAGEWNRAAAANNRIEVRTRPVP